MLLTHFYALYVSLSTDIQNIQFIYNQHNNKSTHNNNEFYTLYFTIIKIDFFYSNFIELLRSFTLRVFTEIEHLFYCQINIGWSIIIYFVFEFQFLFYRYLLMDWAFIVSMKILISKIYVNLKNIVFSFFQ